MPENRKADLRVQKTQRALIDAMFRLLEEKTLEEITVSDLCDAAMIRRATFYKHFKDKYEFFDFCVDQRQQKHQTAWQAQGNCDPLEQYLAITREMICFVRENRALFERTMERSQGVGLMERFDRRMSEMIARDMGGLQDTEALLGAPPEIVNAFFTGAMIGVTKWWLMHEPEMTEDELIASLRSMITCCMPKEDK